MRRISEGQYALGALTLLAAWLFVGLPLLFLQPPKSDPPSHSQTVVSGEGGSFSPRLADTTRIANQGAEENQGTEFWPLVLGYRLKITDTLLVAFTFGLTIFTGLLWRSTDKLWAAGERTLTTTERAFVFIDGFNVELTTAGDRPLDTSQLPERYRDDPGLYVTRFAAQPRWKNGGNTPTENLTIQVEWRGPAGPIPPEYTYREEPRAFFLGPQTTQTSDYVEMPGAQALVAWAGNPIAPQPMMFIWGRADYNDVFGRSHFIEWCYQVRFSRPIRSLRMQAEFIQWGEYNRSDS